MNLLKQSGTMVPVPVQEAVMAALSDDQHGARQKGDAPRST